MVTLHDLPKPPDYRAIPAELDRIRAKSREQAAQYGGAIIEVELCVTSTGVAAVREIMKVPQQPTGMGYLGSLSAAVAGRLRTSLVMAPAPNGASPACATRRFLHELMQSGEVKFAARRGAAGTVGCKTPTIRSIIRSARRATAPTTKCYDVLFPDHPLSRVAQPAAADRSVRCGCRTKR